MWVDMFPCKMWKLFIVLAILAYSNALTEEDIKMDMTKKVMKCNEKAGVDMMELALLQTYVIPTNTAVKCVLACAYKASKIMTSDGLYDLEHAYKIAEQMKNGDEKRLVNAKKMADVCVKVNDVKVSDGEKGCERAALVFKCTADNAKKFGFKLI